MQRYILDIEADNLLDNITTIHCVVLRDPDTDNVFTYHGKDIHKCIPVMEKADQLIGHNLIGYDMPALEKLWQWSYTGDILDTLVCSRTIWPNMMQLDATNKKIPTKLWGSHSLKAWGYRLKSFKGDYGEQESAWDTFSMEMLEYCVQDTQVTQQLYDLIISKEFSADAINLEHKMAKLLFLQEQHGFEFDVSKAESLFSTLAQRKQEIEDELIATFEPTIVELKTKTKVIPFNPSSRQQIADRLMKRGWKPKDFTPSGEPKVDESVLQGIDMPEAKLLCEYLMLAKRLGQLATGKQGWLKLVKNGKIHGRVNHMGAVTSRCTHSNPNTGQVPSVGAPFGKECRELFTVPKGYSLLGADASGLELRCLAHYTAAYDNGKYGKDILEGDIHTTNQKAAGLESRPQAKTFIYGFLDGAGDAKIGSIIGKGAKEGKKIKKKFLDRTPALKKLREAVNKAAERGWIKGLDQRRIPVRHSHAALNTLLQSCGSILCKRWYVTIVEDLQDSGYTKEEVAIVAFVHDEVQVQVKKGLEEKVGELIIKAMHKTEDYYKFRCPLDSEYSFGESWADTH